MMEIRDIPDLLRWRKEAGGPVGFVPTLGGLHAGHGALMAASLEDNQTTLVSIFLNPTQFDDPADCSAYPASLEADLAYCRERKVPVVFLPAFDDLYPDGYTYRVEETHESRHLEGASRPGHFSGMLTVVLKLLLLVRPDNAYFGEKDWQQLQLIKGLAEAFFLPTCIVAVPTVRAADGLALSTRNTRLSEDDRRRAPAFHRIMATAPSPESARQDLETLGFEVEYVEDRHGRRLGAVRLEGTRLIDNLDLQRIAAPATRESAP